MHYAARKHSASPYSRVLVGQHLRMRSASWHRFGSKLSRESCPGLGILFVTEPCVRRYSLQHPAAASFNYRFPPFPQAAKERKKKQKRKKWLLLLSTQFPPLPPEGEYYKGNENIQCPAPLGERLPHSSPLLVSGDPPCHPDGASFDENIP